MADEQQQAEQEQEGQEQASTEQEAKTYTAEEVQALLEKETGGLKSKLEEVLGEKKTATQKARELEEQKRKDEEERLRQNQEFQTLYEREQEEKAKLKEQYESYQQQVQNITLEKESAALASELSSHAGRRDLLAEKIKAHTKYGEDGKVSYELGGMEVGKDKLFEHLRKQYDFLVDGIGSSGGSAPGGGRGVGDAESKNKAADDAAKKGDLSGYLAASLTQNMKRG